MSGVNIAPNDPVPAERARKIGRELVDEIERLRTELGGIRREMQMRRRRLMQIF